MPAAALLDSHSLGTDIDLASLAQTSFDWQIYAATRQDELHERIRDTAVIITNKVVIDAAAMSQAKALQLICVAATGTNNVDLEAARQRNIRVCNVTGYATASVVQHVLMLMLTLSTRLLDYRDAVNRGDWQRSEYFCLLDFPITELQSKTLGIIGYGELGRAVAAMAEHLGMQVLVAESLSGAPQTGRVALHALLPQVDVLSLHCPLSEASRMLMNARRLAQMKPGAILINTARGGIVDEVALLNALQSRQLGGAGIDVLAVEPPETDSPLLQQSLNNLIVTPHIAWASTASRQRLFDEVVSNILAWQDGKDRNQIV